MVLFFSPEGHKEGTDDWLIYMGKDKHENEDLIKYGLPEDVWCAFAPAVDMGARRRASIYASSAPGCQGRSGCHS